MTVIAMTEIPLTEEFKKTDMNLVTRQTYTPPRLTKYEKAAFAAMGMSSISFVGPSDNRGCNEGILPISPWLGSDWAGKAGTQVDLASATYAQGLLFRLWLDSKADAKRLLMELPAFFANRAVKLRGDWQGLPADVDLLALQIDVIDFAASLGLHVLDDEAVLKVLRSSLPQAA